MKKTIISLAAVAFLALSAISCASHSRSVYRSTTEVGDNIPQKEVWRECNVCKGKGSCHSCRGTGKISGDKCKSCMGTGKCRTCGGNGGYTTEY
ncbi:MAG: hypothetical protein K5764_05580 [Prevotella sp.]|nr:hypothetical protein [Prevotella sp.]